MSTPRVAAITMVRDEAAMLPRWVSHYTRQLGGSEHLYVVDDNSVDGSTDDLPCSVSRIEPIQKHFELERMRVVSDLAASLLTSYDAVLFTDADEFLVAEPRKYADLRDLVADRPDQDVIGVMGLNVVHHVGVEPALRPDRLVLEQRSLAKFLPLMCKPAIKRTDAPWAAASHGIAARFEVDPDAYMFHLKFADREALRAAADHRRRMVDMDGRAAATNWASGGDALVSLLEQITSGVDPVSVEKFKPGRRRLGEIVKEQDNGVWRATGGRQLQAMQRQPLVRIPKRFKVTV